MQKEALSSDRKKQFVEELNTLSGALKAKLEDMDLLAGFDLNKLPKPEEAGECCIQKTQEYMIHDVSSKEVAVLPEDTLQKLAVRVCIFV